MLTVETFLYNVQDEIYKLLMLKNPVLKKELKVQILQRSYDKNNCFLCIIWVTI